MIERKKYINKIKNVFWVSKSVFLVWARQVWKTSLMKYILWETKWFYINFDEIATLWVIEFNNLWEFINYINSYFSIDINDFDILCFDEVIRIKNFNIILKWFIEKYPKIKTISSASWNYEIVWDIIDWLAGRIVKIEVFPLDFKEFLFFKWKNLDLNIMSENIYKLIENDLFEYITFWSYPEVALENSFNNKKIILKSIIDSIFEKDLRNFISQDKILDLKKLILYLSKNIWSLFSYEWLASDLGLKLNDVKKFIFLLEKSYLIFTINPFFTNKKAEYSKKQKIYFNNFWIVNYFTWNLDLKNIIDWKDVEETLFLNLRYNLEFNDNLFFYQKVNGSEIDFILKRNWKITPIEAKLSNKDIIPKIFNSFYEVYSKEIDYFIKSTKNINFTRDFNQTKVLWIPFYNIF